MSIFAQWLDTYFAGFDRAILAFYHEMAEMIGVIATPILKVISIIGDDGIGLIILGLILLFFKQTRKSGFAVLIALLIGTLITNETIKPLVQRIRPFNSGVAEYVEWWKFVGAMEVGQFSFPSGHTTSAMAVMMALGFTQQKRWVWLVSAAFVMLTGMSRNYFMVHYPTDIVVGAIAGAVAGILAALLVKHIANEWSKRSKRHKA